MVKNKIIGVLVTLLEIAVLSGFIGCSVKNQDSYEYMTGAPRLVINGTVSNEEGKALGGIYVAIYGVREETEQDLLTYNYAVTDQNGRYEIIRYRGRELANEVTVVATDSGGIYEEQWQFAPIRYDSTYTAPRIKEPTNGFATADFILKKK